MVDVEIRLAGDTPVLEISDSRGRVRLELDPSLSFRDGQNLRDSLRNHAKVMSIQNGAPSSTAQTLGEANAEPDWSRYLITCACGRRFRDSGLGGLGKHAANCEHAQEQLQIDRTESTTIYRPIVEAIYSWSNQERFSTPHLKQQFESHRVSISYSAIRGHIDWLQNQGLVEKVESEGRKNFYRFIAPLPTDLAMGNTETLGTEGGG